MPTYSGCVPDVFSALANPLRRQILQLLLEQDRSVGELAACFSVGRPAISEHLQVLRQSGLVGEERRGQQRIYHLEGDRLAEVRDWLTPFERYWRTRLKSLNDLLDEENR